MTTIPGTDGTAEAFLAEIETLLTDPAGRISVSSLHILSDVDPNLRQGLLDHAAGDKPSTVEHMRDLANASFGSQAQSQSTANQAIGTLPVLVGASKLSPVLALIGLAAVHGTKQFKRAKKFCHIDNASRDFAISRAAIGLRDNEKAALRGMALLRAENRITWEKWRKFYSELAWAGGKAEITAPPEWSSSKHIDDARRHLITICTHVFPDHEQFIASSAATLGEYAKEPSELGRMIASLINTGARWMRPEDVPTSKVFKTTRTRAALQIGGFRPDQQPLYFDGNESLATIAGAGTGKSAAQVIPNLLTYPGSCFVLDVKDELWRFTAGHRKKAFGDVYRFAPTDHTGNTHRYNPFNIIPLDAAEAERECQVMASMIIPESANGSEPFWSNKAREYLWAFSMAVAFNANPGWRTLASVSRLFAMQGSFPNPDDFQNSDTKIILDGLDNLAQKLGIPALAQSSSAIHSMLNNQKTLQSIFDTARSHLNPITRSPTALAAMSESDWHPLDLRRKPGTTVYLCLKPDDMRAYAPLVRLVFQQHVSQLTRNFTPKKGELPVTFFLDEMPQLGHMPNMTDLVDVGRGAGVRLWMFMQYMGQLLDVYQARGPGLIESCRIRSYMSPDTQAAKAIEPLLGENRNIFSGEKKPLAYSHELAGREFENDVIVVARGEHPARLAKLPYYEDAQLSRLTKIPPPTIRKTIAAVPASQHTITTTNTIRPLNAPKPATTSAAIQPVQRNRDPVIRPRQS